MRTLTTIAATLGVMGAIAVGTVVPVASIASPLIPPRLILEIDIPHDLVAIVSNWPLPAHNWQ